ncbi:hypothetical protein QAD02_022964 [Eretmocerus hayati]|uniref:Uncharacterized protein n=1 Tax=Eretmocerus hayati TaxID=131215 RepID=A0ACC2PUQ5_9HYME|nr:hypothetical protein QAD02_022964 [Eretmocerus hayati]
MEYDSESSVEDEHRNHKIVSNENDDLQHQSTLSNGSVGWQMVNATSSTSCSNGPNTASGNLPLGGTANKSLSTQVMEYYHKYSQNSKLSQYFLPTSSTGDTVDGAKYYYSIYEFNANILPSKKSLIGHDYGIKSCIPKERRRWARPPLIGQSSSTESSSSFVHSMTEIRSPCPDPQHQDEAVANTAESLTVTEEKSADLTSHDSLPIEQPIDRKGITSPTSSVASLKPLEWDSGADVGYLYATNGQQRQLGTIERMALARGCSAAMRLDPEGTTAQQQSTGSFRATVTSAILSLSTKTSGAGESGVKSKPDANSTPLLNYVSESESEIEITPIVKNHVTGIENENDVKVESNEPAAIKCKKNLMKNVKDDIETPKSAAGVFKLPHALRYTDEQSNKPVEHQQEQRQEESSSQTDHDQSPLKKSSSMNLLASPTSKLALKRSQSDLNICGNEKHPPRLIFQSTSSIATVVNKPPTCNKLIQTSIRQCAQESVAIQVSDPQEEEKPPLPKRATSLVPSSLNSILKNSKSTYRAHKSRLSSSRSKSDSKEDERNEKEVESISDSSQNGSLTPQADDIENATGRANSFEYFPGHIYENVPNGSTSHVSSVDTGRSNSTMPNTSSSIDEKLWGDSDSLVRDLERSVNVLKSLVDANKLNKQVEKRLIHHVVKRLVTAKYADDRIEHNLEDNVPWNPADARNKVYRAEIIKALTKNTSDSSDDWKPSQKKKTSKKPAVVSEVRNLKEIMSVPAGIESSNSEKFERNTDRTVMDGRKARMGLRADDCEGRCSSNTPTNKSESSECFMPQRGYNANDKMKDIYNISTTNSSPQDQNRALIDSVVDNRRSPMDSSNEAANSVDWRLPTTASERRYEMRRCSNSDSVDAKLVSYAEMEKRNQLIWITNEISHLSNLKKLLEQSKTKSEKRSKSSPRKNITSSSVSPIRQQKSSSAHHQKNGYVSGEGYPLSRQWSSHCNLANCPTPSGTSLVRRLKKRNSSSQTATESSTAYSRTGSEIVSARIQNPNIKCKNVSVQTSKLPPCPTPVNEKPQMPLGGRSRQSLSCNGCACRESVCLVCRSQNLSKQTMHNIVHGDESGIHVDADSICNDSEDVKKTKNQLNSTRLKCRCNISDNCKSSFEISPSKTAVASQTYHNQYSEDSSTSARRYGQLDSNYCQSTKDCDCENELTYEFDKLQVNELPNQRFHDKTANTGCVYSRKKIEQTQNGMTDWNCNPNQRVQPYFTTSNSNTGTIPKKCSCDDRMTEQKKSCISSKHVTRAKSFISNDMICCRVCGKTHLKDRRCVCVPKTYPKPVAYELSFADCHDNQGRLNVEIRNIDNSTPLQESTKGTKNCACDEPQTKIQFYECDPRERRLGSDKKNSLQEYLVTNNPNFAESVETRRQYVSEIQRLRQLRKDKRMQLLAKASTNDVLASLNTHKATRYVQRRITDEEMKIRRRKRHFELSEVRAKRRQQRLQEEARCNKLMAKIFCKKLQQNVLKGRVDLSQSVSVISNI